LASQTDFAHSSKKKKKQGFLPLIKEIASGCFWIGGYGGAAAEKKQIHEKRGQDQCNIIRLTASYRPLGPRREEARGINPN